MTSEAREHSFDELARALASGSISRRKALRLMGAALVGGTLASVGIGEAAADPPGCKRNGKKCKRDTQCCSGKCEGGTCAAACPPNRVELSNGTCAFPCGSQEPIFCFECACNGGCVRAFPPPPEGGSPAFFCSNQEAPVSDRCQTHADCPSGQFCAAVPPPVGSGEEPPSVGFCVEACPGVLC
jgi:hypothetical protein